MLRNLVYFLILSIAAASLAAEQSLPTEPKRGSSPWGPEDQRGAANRITPEKVLDAARLISKGEMYLLGREYEETMPYANNRHYSLIIPQPAPPLGKNRIVGYEEFISTQLGQVGTQLDGLGHVGVGDKFFNGFDRREYVTPKGLSKLGVENVGAFFTRGLLLDIAKLKGKEMLEMGHLITAEDLKAALKRQALAIRPGDVVLLHTGWGRLWNVDNERYAKGEPGIGIGAAQFLVEQQITLVGADTWGVDVLPNPDPELLFPAHQILIPNNGIYILENLDTSELARDQVYEFAFSFAPLRLKGATGSPGNPVAIR